MRGRLLRACVGACCGPAGRSGLRPRACAKTHTRESRSSQHSRWRPYRVECTGSLPTSEVKRRRARLVLGWGTAREDLRVLPAFASGRLLRACVGTCCGVRGLRACVGILLRACVCILLGLQAVCLEVAAVLLLGVAVQDSLEGSPGHCRMFWLSGPRRGGPNVDPTWTQRGPKRNKK